MFASCHLSSVDGFTSDLCSRPQQLFFFTVFFVCLFFELLEGAVNSSSAVCVSSTNCEVHICPTVFLDGCDLSLCYCKRES